jgi:predicted Zn-dependent protease
MAIQAGSIQFQIDFTRDNEKEADRVGMQTLSKSNYNPRSMPIFFERLQQSSRYYGRDIPEFLRTHPVSASRISDTRGRSNKYAYKQYPDTHGYLITKAKLRAVTSANKKEALSYFKAREHQGTKRQRAIARYGIALVNLQLQQFTTAESIFQQVATQYPEQPQYAYALAKTALEAQDYKKAISLFEKAINRFSSNNALKVEYISALLKIGNAQKAKVGLQSLDYKTKKSAIYFELLANTYAQLNQPAESHRYLAEVYYAIGRTQAAILQINLAKKAKGVNEYLQEILDDRLRFFVNEERERKLNR